MIKKTQKKCGQCKYYYITWNKNLPHGCRAMNFKSRRLPSDVVKASTGQSCRLFEPKAEP